jgi:CubicO group peptidase (beta-lactamase class C family)
MRRDVFDRPHSAIIDGGTQLPLLCQPGTHWYYHRIAVDILGQVIQVVLGMALGDFLKERLFTPLGMVATAFAVPADTVRRLAALYSSEKLYNPPLVPPDDTPMIDDVTLPTVAPSGGGGLVHGQRIGDMRPRALLGMAGRDYIHNCV